MHLDPRHNRPNIHLFAEARLCFDDVPGAPSSSPIERGAHWTMSQITEWTSSLVLRPAAHVGQGVWRALRDAFRDNPTEDQRAHLRRAIDFLNIDANQRMVPEDVRRKVEDKILSPTLNLNATDIAALTNPENWLSALLAASYDDGAATGSLPGAKTPLEIVNAYNVQDRRDLFLAFVDQFFTHRARGGIRELGASTDPATRFNTHFRTLAQRTLVINAMRGMIGLTEDASLPADTRKRARAIAVDGLNARYFQDSGRRTRTGSFDPDYRQAIRQNPGRARVDQLRNPDAVDVPAFFRGAMRLNVVNDEDLRQIADMRSGPAATRNRQSTAVRGRARHELQRYFGVLNAETQRRLSNADRIPTWVWFALALVGFANKNTRTLTTFGAGLLGLMYLNGNDRPHRDAADFLGRLTGLGAGTFREVAGGLLPHGGRQSISQVEVHQYADDAEGYLTHINARIEASTGFGALLMMPIAHIMTAYTPGAGTPAAVAPGTRPHPIGEFNPNESIEFQRLSRTAVPEGRGIRRGGIVEAFNDTTEEAGGEKIGQRNTREVSIVLENVCFELLKEKGDAEQKRKAALVSAALVELPEGQHVYQQLPNDLRRDPVLRTNYKPRDLFYDLVREGRLIAQSEQRILLDFICPYLSRPTRQQENEQKAAEDREKRDLAMAHTLRPRIEALSPAAGYTFAVVITEGASPRATVTLTGPTGRLDVPISITDFARRTPDNFSTFWVERAAAQRKAELENPANFPPGFTPGTFAMRLATSNAIQYGRSPLAPPPAPLARTTAESNAYLFLSTSTADIYEKYKRWHNRVITLAPGVAPGNRNALE